jgi:cadmium resistance protein CadD (predicted permease)
MKNQIFGYIFWFGIACITAAVNVIIAILTPVAGADGETAMNTLGSFIGGLFMLIYALLAANAALKWQEAQKLSDENKCEELTSLLKKRIPAPLWIMLGLLALALVALFHFFHFQYVPTLVMVHGILAFTITFSLQALWDIDDPRGGVFNITLPKGWKEN